MDPFGSYASEIEAGLNDAFVSDAFHRAASVEGLLPGTPLSGASRGAPPFATSTPAAPAAGEAGVEAASAGANPAEAAADGVAEAAGGSAADAITGGAADGPADDSEGEAAPQLQVKLPCTSQAVLCRPRPLRVALAPAAMHSQSGKYVFKL